MVATLQSLEWVGPPGEESCLACGSEHQRGHASGRPVAGTLWPERELDPFGYSGGTMVFVWRRPNGKPSTSQTSSGWTFISPEVSPRRMARLVRTSDTPAYSFSGPHLTVGQGNPVPVLLGGPLRIGGALISMGISSETWPLNGLGGMGDEANPGTAIGNEDTVPWVWAKKPA